MKILKNITYLALVVLTVASCDIADPIESEITEYANFEMTGDSFLYIQTGTPFVEPGVNATAGGEELEVEISGSVDSQTPGVYNLTYSAVNSDGFPASVSRLVAVGDKEVAFNRDLSGVYLTGTRSNTVTRTAPGVYQNSDVLPNNGISVFMVDLGNGSLIIPSQPSRFGSVAADPSVDAASFGVLNSESSFTLNLKIGGNPIFVRTFLKQ